jgi:predicted O-methyltransferase YrrM
MTDSFDREYWEQRWQAVPGDGPGSMAANPPNPHLVREISDLTPGTALDAGAGAGAEAVWLASCGWQVTAADISAEALSRAAERARVAGVEENVRWIEADVTDWAPSERFDLVTTHYAHPAMSQLDFYDRLAEWVAPGGTLLIVGHADVPGAADHAHGPGHEGHPPPEAMATARAVTARLDDAAWNVVTAGELPRSLAGPGGREVALHDVVVRAVRRAD